MKRILAAAIAAVMLISAAACTADSSGEYPVSVASYTFESRPASVICLSDSLADIMIACGYAGMITGKTDECTQEELTDVPSVGNKNALDVDAIKGLSPDVVFTDNTVSVDAAALLSGENTKVLNMMTARSEEDLIALFRSVGAVMDGKDTGRTNGEKKAKELLETLNSLQKLVPESSIITTVCYLYDENGTAATGATMSGRIFRYANAENVCVNSQTPEEAIEMIKLNNPSYIFCAPGMKDSLAQNESFKGLEAVKSGRVYEIDPLEFERQGDSMTDTLSFIIETIYPQINEPEPSKPQESKQESSKPEESKQESSKPEESKQESSKPEESKQESSKPEESKQESSKPEESSQQSIQPIVVTADDSLQITDTMYFEYGEFGDDIEKLQNRLKNLGYGEFDEITDYFGYQTEDAYKEFESKNGFEEDGFATAEELKLLFSADVKPAR